MQLYKQIRVQMFLICAFVASPNVHAQNHEDEGAVSASSEPVIQALSILPFENAFFTTMFYWQDLGWNAKHGLYWDNPSHFSIDSDGNWYFYAKRIANFRRRNGPADTGWTFSYRGDVRYYTSYDPDRNQCSGQNVHSEKYVFGSVSYKDVKHNTDARGVDRVVAEKSSDIKCASLQLWFY